MVSIQKMCEQGDLAGLRGALDHPKVLDGHDAPSLAERAEWNRLHPEANDRHDDGSKTGHTLIEIAAANGHLGEFSPSLSH